MARNTITQGPSNWHLLLAIFEPHPPGGGTRTLSFVLKNGFSLRGEWRGLRGPDDVLGPWKIAVHPMSMPHGYYYSRKGKEEVEVFYDPLRHTGWVELNLTSGCCGDPINDPVSDDRGGKLRFCSKCHHAVLGAEADGPWLWLSDEITRQNGGKRQELRVLEDPAE